MERGDWLHNPVTGELAEVLVAPLETGGVRLEAGLWLTPNAAVMGTHVHAGLTETFEVLEGEVGFHVDGAERRGGPGTRVTVPAGVAHDWWNAGAGRAHVHVAVESVDPSVPEAGRFASMIEAAWALGALGRTNTKGVPKGLWLVALADEYRDVMELVSPPPAVQRVVFGALAPLARRRGRDVTAPDLRAAAHVPAPIGEPLAAYSVSTS